MKSWFRQLTRAVLGAGALAVLAGPLWAQGVTTGAISGRVTDGAGAPVAGALVQVVYLPTGFRISTTSTERGLYQVQGLEPGGPYRLTVRAIGFRPVARDGIVVTVSQTFPADFAMERTTVELEELVVQADNSDLDFGPTRQGTQTTISDSLLRRLPTLDRDFTDFATLTPQVQEREGGGVAVAGQNNRFNTIQVDGSTVNDRFGLGRTGQTGGQANGRAVGIEAIKEYQVLLAPYDVRQGNFTGALINAVTKSGTNEYSGSAFFYYRNEGLAGDPLGLSEFTQSQFGASLGGPIKRDKAHFFLNAEFRRRTDPADGPYLGQPASLGTPVFTQAGVDAFNSALQGYGLPTGTGTLVNNKNPLANLLARGDVQLGDKHRLVLRYSYNSATDDIFSRTSSTSNPVVDLSSAGYQFENRTHNPAAQLFTNWANGTSNELRVSLNRVRDKRDPNAFAPLVTVSGFSNGTATYQLRSGAEEFSQGNELDQDIWELTNNFTFPKGDHRITIGTRNEYYKVRNLFAQSSFGVWSFDDLTNFQNGVASRYQVGGDIPGGGEIEAKFKTAMLGFYAQDQWQVNPKFNLTYGLRVDIPVFFDQPEYDSRVVTDFGNRDVPSGQFLWSPRVGFNWDAQGRGETQVRGGLGIFTGAPAFVWMSNAYSNNGTGLGRLTCSGANAPAFTPANFNPASPTLQCVDGTGITTGTTIGEVDLVGSDTKFPQVLRANLALDKRLPMGVVGTIEAQYTKGINDYFIVNRNLNPSVGTDANGRVMYGTFSASGGSNPSYFNQTLYGPSFSGGVYDLLNTSKNYSWNIAGVLRKRFSQRVEGSVAYSYSEAKDVQSFTSSRAISNWRFGRSYAGDQLVDEATRSSFDRPHRIVISGTYTFPWRYATDISLTYIGQSGQPYTYLAGGSSGRGDLNADGTNGNDPIYIPRDAATELTFVDITGGPTAAQQAAAFDQLIASESCLSTQRGRIMARNSCRNPWQNLLNLSARQSLPEFGYGRLALELSVFNVLNLLNSDWGQAKTVGGTDFFTDNILTMVSADAATQTPRFQFNTANLDKDVRIRPTSSTRNSYQVQVGARYAF